MNDMHGIICGGVAPLPIGCVMLVQLRTNHMTDLIELSSSVRSFDWVFGLVTALPILLSRSNGLAILIIGVVAAQPQR